MSFHSTRIVEADVVGVVYRLRVLDDEAHRAHPADSRIDARSPQQRRFAEVSPAAQRLAEAMHDFDIDGKRVLELGCGLGLASLVLQRRDAEVVAADANAVAGALLASNAALNDLPAVRFHHLDDSRDAASLGRFDIIIASDTTEDRAHAEAVAAAVAAHAQPDAEVVVTDAGHLNAAHLVQALASHGFWFPAPTASDRAHQPQHVMTLQFRRAAVAA